MSQIYGEKFMSNSNMLEWYRKFKDGRTDICDNIHQRLGGPCEDLAQLVDQVVR